MNEFEYNRDYSTRYKIIFDKEYNENNKIDCVHFFDLSFEKLKKLIELKFADPDDTQNDAPTIKQFYDLVNKHFEQHPEITEYISFHGYIIAETRSDYRVSIEGLKLNWFGLEDMDEFVNGVIQLTHDADDFQLDIAKKELYCWYN